MGRSRRRLCVSLILFVYFNASFLYHLFSFTHFILLCPILNPLSIIWVSPLGVVLLGPACYVACGLLDGVLRILKVWKTGVAISSIFANSSSVPCTFRFGLHFSQPFHPSTFFFYLSLVVMKGEKTQKRKECGEAALSPRLGTSVQNFGLTVTICLPFPRKLAAVYDTLSQLPCGWPNQKLGPLHHSPASATSRL